MSLNELIDNNRSYRNSECRWSNNIANPERCPAADKYTDKLNEFVTSTLSQSQSDTSNKFEDLLKKRTESMDYKRIYPLVNYDFDYKTAMRMQYNPYKLGITNKPTMSNLIEGPTKMKQYFNVLVTDKYPNEDTIPGLSDIVPEDTRRKEIADKYKVLSEEMPYPTFRKDYPECLYPTSGEHSSSYFIRTGSCPTSIKNRKKCEDKQYTWVPDNTDLDNYKKYVTEDKKNIDPKTGLRIKGQVDPGSCFKPRFIYVDNSGKGILNKNGLAPSVLNDILNLSPDKISSILSGQSVDGTGLLPCVDSFVDYKKESPNFNWYKFVPIVTIISSLLFIKYLISKKTK